MTAQRRKAERAAAEVLAILDSQGFGRLSDAADDSGSEDEADTGDTEPGAAERDGGGGNAAEDALSGSELGAPTPPEAAAAAAQAGGLSWRGPSLLLRLGRSFLFQLAVGEETFWVRDLLPVGDLNHDLGLVFRSEIV